VESSASRRASAGERSGARLADEPTVTRCDLARDVIQPAHECARGTTVSSRPTTVAGLPVGYRAITSRTAAPQKTTAGRHDDAGPEELAGDAALSTARAWRTTVLALAVITTATLVVSLSLAFSLGVRSAVSRLAASAGMSVFLSDEAQEADVTRVADALRASPLVESVRFVSRSEARDRFVAAFPDLATGVRDDVQALPLSFDVSLRSGAEGGVAALVEAVRADEAVSDVRYDQQWIARLERIGAAVGRAGFVLGVLLTLAAWTMLYAVVRLATWPGATRSTFSTSSARAARNSRPVVIEGAAQACAGHLPASRRCCWRCRRSRRD
jgi:cell division transport system permease protein